VAPSYRQRGAIGQFLVMKNILRDFSRQQKAKKERFEVMKNPSE